MSSVLTLIAWSASVRESIKHNHKHTATLKHKYFYKNTNTKTVTEQIEVFVAPSMLVAVGNGQAQ